MCLFNACFLEKFKMSIFIKKLNFLCKVFTLMLLCQFSILAQGGGTEGGNDNRCISDPNGFDRLGNCCTPSEKDCAGLCNGTSRVDCLGECGGRATVDCNGICNGGTNYDCAFECGGSSVVDCTNTCGGDAIVDCNGDCQGQAVLGNLNACCLPEDIGCDGVCNSGQVFDECQVCGGDGAPCLNFCDDLFYQVSVNKLSASQEGLPVVSGAGADLSCIQEMIVGCENTTYVNPSEVGCDQQIMQKIFAMTTNLSAMDLNTLANERAREIADEQGGNWFNYREQAHSEVTNELLEDFYLDENCNPVPSNFVDEQCVDDLLVQYIVSPISLDWKGVDSFENHTLVEFSLSPTIGKFWSVWKGSESFPLLVLDPEKTGQIKSYAQLIGNWTYGGKQMASLKDSIEKSSWRDGYEVLEQMDKDFDGEVSGDELSELSIWFDKNKNAKSEEGEVVDLRKAGVTKLFYKGFLKDSLSGDLKLKIGYEKVESGKVSSGASIDWYGEEFASVEEASFKLKSRKKQTLNLPLEKATKETKKLDSKNEHLQFLGSWTWESIGSKDKYAPKGVLILKENNAGEIVGKSVLELALKKSRGKAKKLVKTFPLDILKTSLNEIVFSVMNQDGSITKSTAKLSKDGKLTGQSVFSVSLDGKTNEKVDVTYEWKGARIN